jgi:hypothetical protein
MPDFAQRNIETQGQFVAVLLFSFTASNVANFLPSAEYFHDHAGDFTQ